MSPVTARRSSRAEVLRGLRARRAEIEDAVRVRVFAISDLSETADPEYLEGLGNAISSAIDFGLHGIERSEESPPPIPARLLAQARIAARNSVSLDTVLRRYLGGYTMLGEFLVQEAEAQGLRGAELKRLLRSAAVLLDRLLAAISDEYTREHRTRPQTLERRREEQVRALMAGERFDAPDLGYELGAWHLALLATGAEASTKLRELASELDRSLLALRREGEAVWAWLGGRRALDPAAVQSAGEQWPAQVSLAIGEPGEGLPGWRLSHRQAMAAMPIALRGPQRAVRYAEVALLATALRDEVLLASLQRLYLDPLQAERDGGEIARQTLRAYFDSGRNVSSAAMALGVSRQTVGARMRAIEERLGTSLERCAVELDVALRLAEAMSMDGPR